MDGKLLRGNIRAEGILAKWIDRILAEDTGQGDQTHLGVNGG